jgi:hypothetical protein
LWITDILFPAFPVLISLLGLALNLLYSTLFSGVFLFKHFKYACFNHGNWLYYRWDNIMCMPTVRNGMHDRCNLSGLF